MRKLLFLPIVLFIMLVSSCTQTRSLTEQYIKTEVEQHEPRARSSIRTYSIYKSPVSSTTTKYVELTGYKYNGVKGMVLGADRYTRYRAKLTGMPVAGIEVTYVILTEAECQAMLDFEPVIRAALKSAPRGGAGEEVYEDYTVKEGVFISYRKYVGMSSPTKIDLWIDGHKYTLPANTFLKKLRKFMAY
jgi:hypothetical protein